MGVGGVVCVACPFIMDKCIWRDVLADDEGRDPDTEAREVVCDVVLVGNATERDTVIRSRDVFGRRNVVGKATVLLKVSQRALYLGSISDGVPRQS